MSLFNTYNNENILIRSVLAGLLDLLNNQIKYEQAWANDDIEEVTVPFYYNQSGDERFNQDFYTHYGQCMPPKLVDGNFDMIPRGAITYNGSSISSNRITSRYVQGRYLKEVDGQLESFVSFLYSIPLTVRISCEIWLDRQITSLKVEQAIREVFYKTKTFYSYFKGMRVGSTVGFPDDIAIEKNIQYSFESDNKIKLTFELEIETYQPVFDPTTEMKANSKIKSIGYSLYPVQEKTNINLITVTSPKEGAIIPKGIPIWIEWSANDKGKITNKVNLQWNYYGENDLFDLQLMIPNHEYFVWNVPDAFTNYKEPFVIWEEDNTISISRQPQIKIIPDLITNEIKSSSFTLINEGYFITNNDDASINISLEMKDDSGNISYSPDGAIWANVKYNVIDITNPISIDPDVSIYFPGTIDFKHIDLRISNSYDTDTFGIINNIKIV